MKNWKFAWTFSKCLCAAAFVVGLTLATAGCAEKTCHMKGHAAMCGKSACPKTCKKPCDSKERKCKPGCKMPCCAAKKADKPVEKAAEAPAD